MRNRSKLLLTALTAALVLAAAVSTASATKLSVSNTSFTATWSSLRFTGLGGLITITCPVTLNGAFSSATINKTRGAQIGNITGARLTQTSCAGGTATILNGTETLPGGGTATNTLPWRVNYDSFTGTLPNITGVRLGLVGAGFLLNVSILGSTVSCLYQSTAQRPAFGIATVEGGRVTGLRAEEREIIPLHAGNAACPASGNFAGTASVSTLSIRLI